MTKVRIRYPYFCGSFLKVGPSLTAEPLCNVNILDIGVPIHNFSDFPDEM